jgi:hypothetical protein
VERAGFSTRFADRAARGVDKKTSRAQLLEPTHHERPVKDFSSFAYWRDEGEIVSSNPR